MIEMGVTPRQWRAQPREDREYLLAMRRLMRRVESIEHDESQQKNQGPPIPQAPEA